MERGLMGYRVFRDVLAFMTWFAGVAAAQIGPDSQLLCVNVIGQTPLLRGEGYSELTGDITITCTSGTAPAT
jgi:hypothetical protein